MTMYKNSPCNDPAFLATPPPPPPYSKGQRFTAQSHIPPSPAPRRPDELLLSKKADSERQILSPLERCLLHPPSSGSFGESTVEFEVSRELRTGRDHQSQIVVVNILETNSKTLPGVTTAVAKIYDPLYFDHSDDGADPFLCVDRFYSYEVASYNRLSDLQGTVTPILYGSYSLELSVLKPSSTSTTTTRSVRLILMEYVQGSSMRELKPHDFSQEERKRIIRLLIDGESAIFTRDIRLGDLHPRNVLLERDSDKKIARVVHIDHEGNWLFRYYRHDPEEERACLPGKYISPLLRWHEAYGKQKSFEEWIDWDYEPWLETGFAHTKASITPEIRAEYFPYYVLERRKHSERPPEAFYSGRAKNTGRDWLLQLKLKRSRGIESDSSD